MIGGNPLQYSYDTITISVCENLLFLSILIYVISTNFDTLTMYKSYKNINIWNINKNVRRRFADLCIPPKKECTLAHSGVSRGLLRHVSASRECTSSRGVFFIGRNFPWKNTPASKIVTCHLMFYIPFTHFIEKADSRFFLFFYN